MSRATRNQNIPAFHNTALPFTRCVAGPADYTPVGFSMPGDVLPVQQLACACLITSPLMTLAENPFYLLREERLHPALEFLRELPVCWNETVVLPQSRVGSLAAFARRSRETWYLAIAAAEAAQETFKLDFLTEGNYTMVLLERTAKRDSAAPNGPSQPENRFHSTCPETEGPSPASSADNEKTPAISRRFFPY